MKKKFINIGKAILLYPFSLILYFLVALFVGALIWLSQKTFGVFGILFDPNSSFSEFIVDTDFSETGYLQGIVWLIAVRFPSTLAFLHGGQILFPNQKHLVFGIMTGSLVLFFAIVIYLNIINYSKIYSNLTDVLRPLLELIIQIGAIFYYYNSLNKED